MLSPENNKVQLLAIVSPVIGAVTILIIIITTAVIAAFCAMKKKKNESNLKLNSVQQLFILTI